MQHRLEGAAVQHLGGVLDPALDELGTGRDALAETGGQVVQHGDLVPGLQKVGCDHTADVAGTAGDQVLAHVATSRRRCAAASGDTSLTNASMPDSTPARNFSLPTVRRIVNSSRCSASSAPPRRDAWCQAEM